MLFYAAMTVNKRLAAVMDCAPSLGRQRLFQIRDQIFLVFDADR